ncbi:Crp/Fnr family transcriptional regulator [Hymenobacter sp. GOD-10R]|uniref:Crp/Fnr family transcriptional regulator n=1 Tax=Hymenobacter sp. GOD-10R TaxID=3093922 RepID=UPI002D7A015A|nr:Crp/Fnr family transcriptional regulator [Hymenobacter sp. GOD-10R]WRQ28971.1 Crp/Fnr family transcriptional regulator [Hymenobacter sp. GOD-10R]
MKGQTIYREGSPALGLYCVHSGKIKVIKVGGDDKEQIVHLGKAGEVLGLAALIARSNHLASAVALEDCVVCFVPRTSFLYLLSSNLQFCTSLLKVLADSLHKAEQGMLRLAYKPVRERLADALLLLLHTYQTTDQAQFSIAISRDDLAALVGTAKETTIRLLSEFKDKGIIASKGSQITILKPEKLVEIAALYD